MAFELIYTSAPKGLKPGSRGFCTVAYTEGMPAGYVQIAETLSAYKNIYQPHDADYPKNPLVFAHQSFVIGGDTLHALARVSAYGSDYTGRNNKLAHSVLLKESELADCGPAALMQQPQFFRAEWSGEPQVIKVPKRVPSAAISGFKASAWERITGDAGWAGHLAQGILNKPDAITYVVFTPGLDMLQLVAEAMALLPPHARWAVTFNTYFISEVRGSTCNWRFVLPDSPLLASARRSGAQVLDLTKPLGTCTTNSPFVNAARTGEQPDWPSPKKAVSSGRPEPQAEIFIPAKRPKVPVRKNIHPKAAPRAAPPLPTQQKGNPLLWVGFAAGLLLIVSIAAWMMLGGSAGETPTPESVDDAVHVETAQSPQPAVDQEPPEPLRTEPDAISIVEQPATVAEFVSVPPRITSELREHERSVQNLGVSINGLRNRIDNSQSFDDIGKIESKLDGYQQLSNELIRKLNSLRSEVVNDFSNAQDFDSHVQKNGDLQARLNDYEDSLNNLINRLRSRSERIASRIIVYPLLQGSNQPHGFRLSSQNDLRPYFFLNTMQPMMPSAVNDRESIDTMGKSEVVGIDYKFINPKTTSRQGTFHLSLADRAFSLEGEYLPVFIWLRSPVMQDYLLVQTEKLGGANYELQVPLIEEDNFKYEIEFRKIAWAFWAAEGTERQLKGGYFANDSKEVTFNAIGEVRKICDDLVALKIQIQPPEFDASLLDQKIADIVRKAEIEYNRRLGYGRLSSSDKPLQDRLEVIVGLLEPLITDGESQELEDILLKIVREFYHNDNDKEVLQTISNQIQRDRYDSIQWVRRILSAEWYNSHRLRVERVLTDDILMGFIKNLYIDRVRTKARAENSSASADVPPFYPRHLRLSNNNIILDFKLVFSQ